MQIKTARLRYNKHWIAAMSGYCAARSLDISRGKRKLIKMSYSRRVGELEGDGLFEIHAKIQW